MPITTLRSKQKSNGKGQNGNDYGVIFQCHAWPFSPTWGRGWI